MCSIARRQVVDAEDDQSAVDTFETVRRPLLVSNAVLEAENRRLFRRIRKPGQKRAGILRLRRHEDDVLVRPLQPRNICNGFKVGPEFAPGSLKREPFHLNRFRVGRTCDQNHRMILERQIAPQGTSYSAGATNHESHRRENITPALQGTGWSRINLL